jgi:hypothetical protein
LQALGGAIGRHPSFSIGSEMTAVRKSRNWQLAGAHFAN